MSFVVICFQIFCENTSSYGEIATCLETDKGGRQQGYLTTQSIEQWTHDEDDDDGEVRLSNCYCNRKY